MSRLLIVTLLLASVAACATQQTAAPASAGLAAPNNSAMLAPNHGFAAPAP